MTLTFGSLFSGFGGADLGFERAGLKCAWQCEIDDYAKRVLTKRWPNARRWDDVRTFRGWDADLICAGPPCQPTSFSGKQLGAADDRWLWPDTLRIIGTIRPQYVVLENPTAILRLHGGREFGKILAALADFGFDAEWHNIPAWAFALPHKRDRTFIVAYPAAYRRQGPICGDLTDIAEKSAQSIGWPVFPSALDTRRAVVEEFEKRLGEPAVFGTPNGIPAWLVKSRLGGIGNAICPPITEYIGRRILEATQPLTDTVQRCQT